MSGISSVFFFKQKTAYEMRISDWSSDVCSSDLFDGVEQIVDATAMRSRQGNHGRDAATGKLGEHDVRIQTIHLVDRQDQRLAAAAQVGQEGLIRAEQASTGIDHEHQYLRLLGSSQCLLRGDRKSTRLNSSH